MIVVVNLFCLDNSMFGTRITGADVVRETLRQKCIWYV